jgi:hypothetical protein
LGNGDKSRSTQIPKPDTALRRRRPSSQADKADAESAVLAAIGAMPEPDHTMGGRLHAIIKASAPALSPKTYYGSPATPRMTRSSASSAADRSLTRGI